MAASRRDKARRCIVLGGNAGASSGEEQLLPSVCRVVAVEVDVNCSLLLLAIVAVAFVVVVLLLWVLPLVLLLLVM